MKPIRGRIKELYNILYGSFYGKFGDVDSNDESQYTNSLNGISNIINKEYFDNTLIIDVTTMNMRQIERLYDLECIRKKCQKILN